MSEATNSFYLLEISVEPGGSRQNIYVVSNNLDEIKQALADEFAGKHRLPQHIAIYLLVCYGQTIALTTYNQGQEASRINLLPFIEVRIPNRPLISFNEQGQTIGFDAEEDEETCEDEADTLCSKLFENEAGAIETSVDWTAAQIPPLAGKTLAAGESITSPFPMPYGYNDVT